MNTRYISAIVTIIILVLIFGIHFEEYEGTVNAFFDGRLLSIPIGDTSIYGAFFVGYIYASLSNVLPQVPWLSVTSTIISIYSLLLFLNLLRNKNGTYNWLLYVVLVVLLAPEIVFISNTRITIIASSAGTAYLLLRSSSKRSWILATPIILYACLYRYESGIIGVLLSISYLFLSGLVPWISNKKAYTTLFAIIFFVYGTHLYLAEKAPHLKQLHYLTYFTTNSSNHTIQVVDGKYELFQEALYNYYYEDTAFFNKMSNNLPPTSEFVLKKTVLTLTNIETIKNTLLQLNASTPELYVFLLSLFFILLIKDVRILSAITNGLIISILLFILIIIRVDARFAAPYLITASLFNTLWFIYYNENSIRQKAYIITLIVMSYFVLTNLARQVEDARQTEKNNRAYIATINKLPQKVIALNLNSMNIFNTGAFDKSGLKGKTPFFADAADFTRLPEVATIIKKEYNINCMDAQSVYGYLTDNENVIYLSSPRRVDFIKKYMNALYGVEIEFEQMENTSPFWINYEDIRLYCVKSKQSQSAL